MMKTHIASEEAGYSLVELLFVIAVIGVAAAMAIAVMPRMLQQAQSDGSVGSIVNALRLARTRSVSERRNIEVKFTDPNKLTLIRYEVPGPTQTTLSTTYLEGKAAFVRFSANGDTGDAFGGTAAISFGSSTARFFSSEGTFIDNTGDPLNGTLFVGVPGQRNTARAITIFGATAFIRVWKWDGAKWVE